MGPPTSRAEDRTAYIASLPRSGSTLLERLLGNHPDAVSLGELSRLHELVNDLEGKCGCGRLVTKCPFWDEVENRAGLDFATTATRLRKTPLLKALVWLAPVRLSQQSLALLRLLPSGRPNARALSALRQIRSAVREITGKPVLIDSSKYALNLKYYTLASPDEFRTLLLVRDGRGVMHSFMRRGFSAESAARTWAKSVRRAQRLASLLPSESVLQIRYEDLCVLTAEEMTRIFRFLGLRPTAPTLGAFHHALGGSPSLNQDQPDSLLAIELDETWRSALTSSDLRQFERIAGELNQMLGYEV